VEVTRLLLLHIVDVVELLGERVVHIDGDDLPIGLTCSSTTHRHPPL
jgi:hypothetical protein